MPIYSAKPPPLNQDYYVFNGGEPEGPYDLPFIEAMVLSAMVASDVSVSKDGKTGWKPLTALVLPPTPKQSFPAGGTNNAPPPFQAPPPKKESHVGRWVLGIIAVLVVIGYANKGSSTQPTYQLPSSTYVQPPPIPVAQTPAPAPVYQPPVYTPPASDTSQPSPQAAPAGENPFNQFDQKPAQVPPPAPTYTVLDSSGRTYRVSQADNAILNEKENSMKQLLGAINRLKQTRAQESRDIETARAYLDNTDQAALDQFNARVDAFNNGGKTLDTWIDSYNGMVQDHNDYLLKVGTPMN